MRLAHALLGLCLAASPAGQEGPAPATPGLSKPLLILEMDGPNRLRRAFLPTDFGSMLASRRAREIWPELWDRVNGVWYGDQEPDGFLAYGGRIRLLAFIEPGSPQRERGLICLEPDRRTGLDGVREQLTDWLRNAARAAPVDRNVGARSVQTVYLDTPGTITLPQEIDGRLVSFFGNEGEIDWIVEAGLESLRSLPPQVPDQAPFSLMLDLEQIASLARAETPGDRNLIDEVYGLASLRDLRVLVRAAGPRVLGEVSLGFGEEERGIFAGVMPDTAQRPTWHLVPEGAKPWMVAPLDLEPLVRKVVSFLSLWLSFRAPDDPVAEMRKQIVDQFGFDLFDDLLAHVGNQVTVIHKQSPPPEIGTSSPFRGLCLVFQVLQREPVGSNFAKLLEESGYATGQDSESYRGVQVHGGQDPTGAGSLYYALTSDLLVLGFDDPGLELLHSVLDAARAGPDGSTAPAVSRVLSHAPEGLNGVGLADVPTVLQGGFPYLGAFFSLVPWAPWLRAPVPDREESNPQRLARLLRRYGLEDLVMFTGYADSRWRLRLLW